MLHTCVYEGVRGNVLGRLGQVSGVCADLWTQCDKYILSGTQLL